MDKSVDRSFPCICITVLPRMPQSVPFSLVFTTTDMYECMHACVRLFFLLCWCTRKISNAQAKLILNYTKTADERWMESKFYFFFYRQKCFVLAPDRLRFILQLDLRWYLTFEDSLRSSRYWFINYSSDSESFHFPPSVKMHGHSWSGSLNKKNYEEPYVVSTLGLLNFPRAVTPRRTSYRWEITATKYRNCIWIQPRYSNLIQREKEMDDHICRPRTRATTALCIIYEPVINSCQQSTCLWVDWRVTVSDAFPVRFSARYHGLPFRRLSSTPQTAGCRIHVFSPPFRQFAYRCGFCISIRRALLTKFVNLEMLLCTLLKARRSFIE